MQDALFSAGLLKLAIDQNDIAGSRGQSKLKYSKMRQQFKVKKRKLMSLTLQNFKHCWTH